MNEPTHGASAPPCAAARDEVEHHPVQILLGLLGTKSNLPDYSVS
ncbi:hypothetical protein [Burkholderia ubonensis]|nr:hypothetical protein [Burkholderia ubonensis]